MERILDPPVLYESNFPLKLDTLSICPFQVAFSNSRIVNHPDNYQGSSSHERFIFRASIRYMCLFWFEFLELYTVPGR